VKPSTPNNAIIKRSFFIIVSQYKTFQPLRWFKHSRTRTGDTLNSSQIVPGVHPWRRPSK
jgi:hypothetical protein